MDIKELISNITVIDDKFDYFISILRSNAYTCKLYNNEPCVGCVNHDVCISCKREPSILTHRNIVFIVDSNTNYYEYEFILKLLACIGIRYDNIGYIATSRAIVTDSDEACIINNINSEYMINKPIKYICISDKAYYKLIDYGYKIHDDKIEICDKIVPFIKMMDIEQLLNDYDNNKNEFVNQLIKYIGGR